MLTQVQSGASFYLGNSAARINSGIMTSDFLTALTLNSPRKGRTAKAILRAAHFRFVA
jgi:hypothetical protein